MCHSGGVSHEQHEAGPARVSRRSDVRPFHVMEVLAAAAERERTHGDVISLCAGQPSTGAPAPARDAAIEATRSGALGYTESVGILPLREAIAAYHRELGAGDVSAEDVVVTTGSSGAFTLLFLAAFDEGDTVWMTRPGYPAYRNTLQALGADVVEIACGAKQRYQPDVAVLDAQLQQSGRPPRGLVIASPANPTGTIIDPDDLAAIARWCERHGTLLVSDEIYHGISFGRPTASAWATSREAVVIGSVSKFFSMTGWRLGWMLVPARLRRRVSVLASNLTICAPAVSQYAAIGAFSAQARTELEGHVETYRRNRELVERRLPGLGVSAYAPPDGAFYAWCDISHLTNDSTRWCADVLAATGVAITPGVDFDPVEGHRFMRMSLAVATSELDEAFDRLTQFVAHGWPTS